VPEPTLATKVSIDLAFNISKLSKSAVLDNQTDWFLSQQLCIYFSGKPAWLKGSRAYTQPNVTPLEMLCKCQLYHRYHKLKSNFEIDTCLNIE